MIFKKIDKKKIANVIKQFYLEISIFDLSNNVKLVDGPPYYQIINVPFYQHFHDKIHSTTKKFLNIIGPRGSGKTFLIPLLLACRSLSFTINSKFIIVIKNDIESIINIKKSYKSFLFPKNSDDKIKCISITSSLNSFIEKFKDFDETNVIIAFMTPIEALKLIHQEWPNFHQDVTFLKKTTFIIDDINERLIETDVLSQDIFKNIFNKSLINEIAKFVIIGTLPDMRYIEFFGSQCDTFSIPIKTNRIILKKIMCKTAYEKEKNALFSEIKNLFDSWLSDDEIDIGSIIVFVSNVNTGKFLYNKILRINEENTKKYAFIIKTKIKKNEPINSLNERLLNKITKESEARKDTNEELLFILPLNLTESITDEEKEFIESSLSLPFVKNNFVRLIITTNLSKIKIPDVTAIFDSGLVEVNYYNSKKHAYIYQIEQLQDDIIKQRSALFYDNNKRKCHFIFSFDGSEKYYETIPFIKRCNFEHNILNLRSIGIMLEDQRNLLNEPFFDTVQDGLKTLEKIGVIDLKTGKLTNEGIEIASLCVSPYLSFAVLKFNENHEFAFLVSLIIEHSIDLVEDSQAPLLCENFCRDSDVVTLLDSILILNTINEKEIKYENSGLSINSLESIYTAMEKTYKKNGKETVFNSILWAKKQEGGIIKMVDKFINLFNDEIFLELRKASFERVVGDGNGSDPTVIYKSYNSLKFKEKENATFHISKRPGWNGFQTPGNIIVLSFHIRGYDRINIVSLLHRDPSMKDKNLGVVSHEVKDSLNSCFFVALLEAYCDKKIFNDIVPIYHSYEPTEEFIFNENNKKTFINYCPKNADVINNINEAILVLNSLIPFVPRSIIVKNDSPSCIVEIVSHGTGINFDNFVYLIDQDEIPKPNAYPLNQNALNYAIDHLNELIKTHPKIRFAITGESLLYKFDKGTQVETDFSYPNVDPKIASVFDPMKSSHLVLLVDYDYSPQPTFSKISWIRNKNNYIQTEDCINDDNDIELITSVSTKILNDLGCVKNFDIFYVTLDGGFPCVDEGEIPESIQNQVGFKEGAIQQGIHKLIQQFEKNFIQNNELQISLKSISSTDTCEKFKDEKSQQKTLNLINNVIINKYNSMNINVCSKFIGPSMICIIIENLPNKETQHPHPKNLFDDSYKPCIADNKIKETLLYYSIPVTTINHVPAFTIIINYLPRLKLSIEIIRDQIQEITDQFGFMCNVPLTFDDKYIIFKVIGKNSCIAIADCISKAFHLYQQCEINSIKNLIKFNNKRIFNENYCFLNIPSYDRKKVKKKIRLLRQEKNITCILACDSEEPELLSQFLYANQKDGTIKTFGICRGCAISLIANFDDIRLIYDKNTHLLDQEKMKNINKPINGLGLIPENEDSNSDFWPQIPIGQIIWALMGDTSIELKCYLKAWCTIVVEFSIQSSDVFNNFLANESYHLS